MTLLTPTSTVQVLKINHHHISGERENFLSQLVNYHSLHSTVYTRVKSKDHEDWHHIMTFIDDWWLSWQVNGIFPVPAIAKSGFLSSVKTQMFLLTNFRMEDPKTWKIIMIKFELILRITCWIIQQVILSINSNLIIIQFELIYWCMIIKSVQEI